YAVRRSSDNETLVMTLGSSRQHLEVDLYYRVWTGTASLLDRWSVIRNVGESRVALCRAASAALVLPRSDRSYYLTYQSGRWGAEARTGRVPVGQLSTVLESQTGLSTSYSTPLFVLDQRQAEGDEGEVWF